MAPTPEEIEQQKMLLTLMGSVYGEAKKLDGNLVGVSSNLRPTSEGVKQLFEGALRSTQPPAPPPPPQPVQVSQPTIVNLPVQPLPGNTPIDIVDNSNLLATLKGIESNLAKLVEVFTQYEVKVKKATNRKVFRSSVEDQRPVHSESGKGQDLIDSEFNGQHPDTLCGSKPYH